jgi:hypothetical protein
MNNLTSLIIQKNIFYLEKCHFRNIVKLLIMVEPDEGFFSE